MNSISYIVPHYENVVGLEKLLASISLNSDDEIIVIDDKSTVETINKIKELKTKYDFQLIVNSTNKGAGYSRNIGIGLAQCEWVIFADSDDFFVKNYSERLLENLHLFYDIIYFSPVSIKQSTNKSVRSNRHEYFEFLINDYLTNKTTKKLNAIKYKFIVPWSKVFKREFLEKNTLYFDEILVSNDVMFSVVSGYKASKVKVTNSVIYCCTENDHSMTSQTSMAKTLDRIDVLGKRNSYLRKRLTKKEYKELDFIGFSFVLLSFRNKYSLSERYNLVKHLKKNKVKIISVNYLLSTMLRLKRKRI
ncbi:glycosyltransferase family 2 protein [Vagococcus fluvialis]|uniref:glycosyltransferase family 2 protein n=1 Tax=Vagococcus fluvialis TaxID=2738 RepID=UPI0022E31163|nr:glycosyltransferase family 2 protein [Vagococcus fluvialis]